MRQKILQLQATQNDTSPRRLAGRRSFSEQEELIKKAEAEVRRLERVRCDIGNRLKLRHV